jgi:hypothetical protein
MTDYSKLPDKEINRAVAKALGHAVYGDMEGLASARTPDAVHVVTDEGDSMVDYCNSWADAGPIILENRIGLEPAMKGDRWVAQNGYFKTAEAHSNPLRAAMIVFLMMKESENVS